MSPTISLAEFITRPVGTIVQGQVDGPPHLQEQSLSLSVKSCASIVEPWMLRHGLYTDVALDRAVSRLSEIIDTYRGDTARLTEIVRHRDLLKESEMSFATGYGGDSVWVQGKGLGEEYMTAAQEKARVDLACAAGKLGYAERLIKEYEQEKNSKDTVQDLSDDASPE